MMFAAVKSSGSQNLGWTHLSPLWSNSRANVANGAATEVLVVLVHNVSENVLRDGRGIIPLAARWSRYRLATARNLAILG